MTTGSMMFYGGIAAMAVGVLAAVICMNIFPKQRKKRLEEISKD